MSFRKWWKFAYKNGVRGGRIKWCSYPSYKGSEEPMFGIFVHYSTSPIYDVSMNLFCWPSSVDIFNILPGFLWQPLLTRSVASLKLKLRSGYKAVDCCRTNKNAEWRSGKSTVALASHQCGPVRILASTPYTMWVEFVVGSRPCFERFFSVYFGFPSPQK